jgi:hypothetical protein
MELRRINIRLKDLAERSRLDKQSQISGLSASEVVRRSLAFYYQWHSPIGERLEQIDVRTSPEQCEEAWKFDPATGKWEFVGLPSEDDILRKTIYERTKKKR